MAVKLLNGQRYGWLGHNGIYIGRNATVRTFDGKPIRLIDIGLSNPYEFTYKDDRNKALTEFKALLKKELRSNSYWAQRILFELARALPYRNSAEDFYLICWHDKECYCHGSTYLALLNNWEKVMESLNTLDKTKTITVSNNSDNTSTVSESTYTEGMTADQKRAFHNLLQFIKSEGGQTTLIGSAGVGKTYLIAKVALWCVANKIDLQFLTPTHKARKVVAKMLRSNEVRCDASTLHSYLKIAPNYKQRDPKTGEVPFTETSRTGTNITAELHVPDESSMYRDDEYRIAVKHLHKIIWVGDDCQLPPVSETPIELSAPFRWVVQHPEQINELTEVVRYKGNALEFCHALRANIKQKIIDVPSVRQYVGGDGTVQHFIDPISWQLEAIELFKQYAKEFDRVKVVTYRNESVDRINAFFRHAMYGKEALKSKYLPGERVAVGWKDKELRTPVTRAKSYSTKPYDKKEYALRATELESSDRTNVFEEMIEHSELLQLPVYYSHDELIVEDVDVAEEDGLTWYFLTVRDEYGLTRSLKTIHETSEEEYLKRYHELKHNCKHNHLPWYYVDAWRVLNDNVVHCYAITADSSQGSSYDYCFVDGNDILSQREDLLQRNKRFYVALTRTAQQLNLYL